MTGRTPWMPFDFQHSASWAGEEITDTTTTAGVTYYCIAKPGTKEADSGWMIWKLTSATGRAECVNGRYAFDNIAANRASLDYTEDL